MAGAQGLLCHRAVTSGQNKNAAPMIQPPGWLHGLRRSTLWPLSMFRMISVLQSRQKTGSAVAAVSGSTRSRRRFRLQTGQVTHPSVTVSLPQLSFPCNAFSPISTTSYQLLRVVSRLKIIRPVGFPPPLGIAVLRRRVPLKEQVPRAHAVREAVGVALGELDVIHRPGRSRKRHAVAGNLDVLHLVRGKVPAGPPAPLPRPGPPELPGLLGQVLGQLPVVVYVHRLRPDVAPAVPKASDLLQLSRPPAVEHHVVVEAAVLQPAAAPKPGVLRFAVPALGGVDIPQLLLPPPPGGAELSEKLLKEFVRAPLIRRQVPIVIGEGEHPVPPAEVGRQPQLQLPPRAFVVVELLGGAGGTAAARPPPPRFPLRDGSDDLHMEQARLDVLDRPGHLPRLLHDHLLRLLGFYLEHRYVPVFLQIHGDGLLDAQGFACWGVVHRDGQHQAAHGAAS